MDASDIITNIKETQNYKLEKTPPSLVTITYPAYQNAFSFYQKPAEDDGDTSAYLQAVRPGQDLTFEEIQDKGIHFKGKIVYVGDKPVAEANFQSLFDNQNIDDLNLDLLFAIYTFMFYNVDPNCLDLAMIENITVDIYLPHFMKFICGGKNYSKDQEAAVIDKLKEYHNIVGVIELNKNGRIKYDRYALLLIHKQMESDKTIRLSSPYMTKLLMDLMEQRILIDKKTGKPVMNNNEPVIIPNYSMLIKGSIVTARCKRATEIVYVVVRIIEQAGKKRVPNVSAATIIDRCPSLRAALFSSNHYMTTSDKNKMLRRTFEAAWKYLEKHTTIKDKYDDIVFPSAYDTPTVDTLDMVFRFKNLTEN